MCTTLALVCTNFVSVGARSQKTDASPPAPLSRPQSPTSSTTTPQNSSTPPQIYRLHVLRAQNAGQMFDCDFNQQLATHLVLTNAKSPKVGVF
jgi:hypothetical protein